jgi:Phage integrase family
MVPVNPVRQLERSERPKVAHKRQCVFERNEIGKLIAAASPAYRPLIATALFSGMRLMELLGLRWQDVDFDHGYLHVTHQLGRDGKLKDLKTTAGERDVVLFAELASLLRQHKAASRYSQPHHPVFASATGGPLHWRNVETRGFDKAIRNAKLDLNRDTKPVLHDCRHTFASLLIAQGLDVVFISRQLGHSTAATTLRVYAHLIRQGQPCEQHEGRPLRSVRQPPRWKRTGNDSLQRDETTDTRSGSTLSDRQVDEGRRNASDRLHTREVRGSIPRAPMHSEPGEYGLLAHAHICCLARRDPHNHAVRSGRGGREGADGPHLGFDPARDVGCSSAVKPRVWDWMRGVE